MVRGTTAVWRERIRGTRTAKLAKEFFPNLDAEQVAEELTARYDMGGNYAIRIIRTWIDRDMTAGIDLEKDFKEYDNPDADET